MIAQFMGRGEAVEIFSQPFGLSNEIKLPYPPPRTGGREARFHPASAADVRCKRKPQGRGKGEEKLKPTGPGKEILMVALQPGAGQRFPILERREGLGVRPREKASLSYESGGL